MLLVYDCKGRRIGIVEYVHVLIEGDLPLRIEEAT